MTLQEYEVYREEMIHIGAELHSMEIDLEQRTLRNEYLNPEQIEAYDADVTRLMERSNEIVKLMRGTPWWNYISNAN